ncbi:MAG: ATP-binding protein [Verrucomicrobiia bacterium]
MKNKFQHDAEALKVYAEYEHQITIRHLKFGCYLVMLLMPAGAVLDYYVYPHKLVDFLTLRLLCTGLTGVIWALLQVPLSRKLDRLLSLAIALLPAFVICWMIYATDGANSSYYVGLILVLLAIALVMRWSVSLGVLASFTIMLMYSVACRLHGPTAALHSSAFISNLFFLVLTACIVVVGGRLHLALRLREFALRYELDKNKRELEETNRKLIELDRLKSQFFANISHELRTPLTLVLSPLETLLQRFTGKVDKEVHELHLTMHSNCMRLLKLINDLLDLIRLEAGRMEIKTEPLDIADFIKGLASAARQVAENKNIKLETYTDLRLGVVAADPDKLEKVVLNLLFNALKFTSEGGHVELRAEKRNAHPVTGDDQSEELAIVVSDTGIGIAEKNLPFVFDRFWQADGSAQRKFQGMGIGLALVKELTEMMHGSVTVESQEGKGATFTVRLPYQKAELPSKAEPGTPTATGAVAKEEWLANLYRRAELFPATASSQDTAKPVELSKRGRLPLVLVADDEPDMRRFLRSQLDEHYDVLEAVDGVQTLEKATQFLPDIILLDMMMPEMDGLAVCQELRKREDTAAMPIILLTARADEETKFNALKMGANDFLAKPFSSTELHARIKNLIESHDFQRKLSRQNRVLSTTIEQLKETESQLVQSEKVASLGRLSAGIIHEINNPLNFMGTALYALRNKCQQLAPEQRQTYQEILGDLEEGMKRVSGIVSDLRAFSHPGTEEAKPVDVTEAINTSLRFLAGEWKHQVEIHQELAPGQMILASRSKLIHVLLNLLQNAMDAMRTKKFENESPAIWIQSRTEGDRGLIIIRDNGPGIEQENLDKIFDPFFTTKDVGKGMGLGLSICHRIVQGYGGRIAVKTEVDRFCEFTLDFPLYVQPVQAEAGTIVAEKK